MPGSSPLPPPSLYTRTIMPQWREQHRQQQIEMYKMRHWQLWELAIEPRRKPTSTSYYYYVVVGALPTRRHLSLWQGVRFGSTLIDGRHILPAIMAHLAPRIAGNHSQSGSLGHSFHSTPHTQPDSTRRGVNCKISQSGTGPIPTVNIGPLAMGLGNVSLWLD